MAFIPSEEQAAIFDRVLATYQQPGRKALAVAALAGTGKTSSIVELIKRIPGCDGIYCAFNKSIAAEVKPKLAGTKVEAKTFHSMGYGILLNHLKQHYRVQQFKTEENKYKDLITTLVIEDAPLQDIIQAAATELLKAESDPTIGVSPSDVYMMSERIAKAIVQFLKELTRFARLKLAEWDDAEALQRLARRVADDELLTSEVIAAGIQHVKPIMEQAEALTKEGKIDFTDMIYWNVRWNLALTKYKWVFIDESQDLSPMQREMVYRSTADNSYTVIIGDEFQSIYAFSGADSDSWDLTVAKFQADSLPLTVTRRCAAIITQHAQTIVPQFRGLPDAPRGKIVWWEEKRLHEVAKPGDLVVCRLKAPVVGACLQLIAKNIPATVLGSDIGKALVSILEKVQKRKGFTFDKVADYLDEYAQAESLKWLKKGDERRAEAIRDECAALGYIIDEMQPKPNNAEDVSDFINTLFVDGDRDKLVTFATGHKSKGLEAERVFILAPERMPLRYKNMTDEEMQQEDNLHYVAITRAKHTLVFLTNDAFLEKMKKQTRPPYIQMDFMDREWTTDPVGMPPNMPILIPGGLDVDNDEDDDILHDEDDIADDNDLPPAAAIASVQADLEPVLVDTRHPTQWDVSFDEPNPAREIPDEPAEPAPEPVIVPDVADVADAAPVSPIGEKALVITPVIIKPETPTVLQKLKANPLTIEDDAPKFTATGTLQADMKAYDSSVRDGLTQRLRKLALRDAVMVYDLLGELIAEMRQAEAVSA